MAFLNNTDIVVAIAFVVFIGILVYFKVPGMIGKMLDQRAERIRDDLDEAKKLREEAQSLLASFERKQKDVEAQARKIVDTAKSEAEAAAVQARADLEKAVARRLQAAEDQIAAAEAGAVGEIRDRAVAVATEAARAVVAKNLAAADASSLIDAAIADVGEKLH